MRRVFVACCLLAGLFVSVAPATAAAKLDPLALAPDPTVVALATHSAITATAWTITATANGNGSITPSGAVSVPADSDRTFTMTPAACAVLANVRVDGVDLGPLATYTFHHVLATHTIDASFVTAPRDTIVASAGPGGTISPAGALVLDCGSSQTYTITPDDCSFVADVLVDGKSQGAVISFTLSDVRASHTIVARFTPGRQFQITASAGPGGTISPVGSVLVGCATNRTFAITANTCFRVEDVVVDGVSQGALTSYTFTDVRAAHTIAATFVDNVTAHTITASAGPGGTISPSGLVTLSCGSNQTFTFAHDRCYLLADVVVDGVSQGAIKSYTFNAINLPHTIAASFTPAPQFTITASASGGSTIEPSGAVPVLCGSSQTFAITPANCAHGFDVQVDGLSQGPIVSYTFTDVNDPHSIVVTISNNSILFFTRVQCPLGAIRPVVHGGPFPPNRTFVVDVQPTGCIPPQPGSPLDSLGAVVTGANGFIVSSNLPCFFPDFYSLIVDVSGNRRFDPECDAITCFSANNPSATNGIEGLEATIAPDGATLSWWLNDIARYRGFRIYRAADGEDETPVTGALDPPAGHPPVQMHWRDDSAAPGSRYAYRIEALRGVGVGSDWFGPVSLSVPAVPQQFALRGAAPNPFHSTTQLSLDMPFGVGAVRLDVFDIAGRRVRQLFHGTGSPGESVVDWNGLNDGGEPVRSGLYLVRLQSAFGTRTTHIVKMD